MANSYIYDTVRTPRGKGKSTGALYTVRPVDLLAGVLAALQKRNSLNTAYIDDVVIGCVTQTGEQGGCMARFAALLAGYDENVPGVTLNRFCGSGLAAVNYASAMCLSGYADLIVAGGVESMSRVKMGSDGGAFWDAMSQWKVPFVPQGISADLLATLNGISRNDVDAFAIESQKRASMAQENGSFNKSLAPVLDVNDKKILASDEHIRPDTTLESLGKLAPSFEMMGKGFGIDALTKHRYPHVESINHIHTAGNSSGIVDGAAAVLIGNGFAGQKTGLKPRAQIREVAVCGTDPILMLSGPVPATKNVLEKAGMHINDIDLFEVNEAFAAVPIWYMEQLGVPHEKLNVHGGAIALGHPLGATGAMLLGTALDALEEKGLGTALITLCIGGGMGIATIIERI